MIMGIDVHHDPRGDRNSIAAVVASINKNYSQWFSMSKAQLAGVELLDSLQSLTLKALIKYKDVNGFPPDRIIVFRDGVGDGRLDHVLFFRRTGFAQAT